MLKFGFSKQKITPDIGVQLAGFLGERKAVGIHDDLFAKVLYLDFSEEHKYIFIALDTLAVFKEFSNKVSESIQKMTGVSKENIFISATHTHSGPEGLGSVHLPGLAKGLPVVGVEDQKLIEYSSNQVIKAVSEAISKTYEGKFEFASFKFKESVFGSRRVEGKENPMEPKILLLKALSGEVSLIYNFGCHPTVLHEENLYISADFPGKVAGFLSQNNSNLEFAMFFNGAAGDISTRFFRKDSSFKELDRIGAIIAENIEEGFASLSEIKFDQKLFESKNICISLKIKKFPSKDSLSLMLKEAQEGLQEAKAKGISNLRLYESKVEGINSLIENTSILTDSEYIDTFIKIISLDNIVFVGIPGEIFSSLGKQIEDGLSPRKVVLVGYSWDYVGYIPDAKAYEEGGYETYSTLLEKGEGEKIVETVIKEVKNMSFD